MRDLGDRRDLVGRVGGAELGELGEADRDRLAVMDDAFGKARDRRGERRPASSLPPARRGRRLDAAAEELRRAGLVDDDVRLAVAEDDAAGPREG